MIERDRDLVEELIEAINSAGLKIVRNEDGSWEWRKARGVLAEKHDSEPFDMIERTDAVVELLAEAIWNEWIRRGNVRGMTYARAVELTTGTTNNWSEQVNNARDTARAALVAMSRIQAGIAILPAPCLDCGGVRNPDDGDYCAECAGYHPSGAMYVETSKARSAKRPARSSRVQHESLTSESDTE